MKLAGVILDQHDDSTASVIRSALRPGEIPELWKEASLENPTELMDEEFALIVKEGGALLRKYATADPASTSISSFYFLQCGDKLPLDAQKTAALNLAHALHDYDLPIPGTIQKLAKAKMADSNTSGLKKVANIVDVTGQAAPVLFKEAQASTDPTHYALVKEGQAFYPIDTFSNLRESMRYFQQYEESFDLADRRQYCEKVAARAHFLDEPCPESMRKYVGVEKSAQALEVGVFWRRKMAGDKQAYQDMLNGIESDAPYHNPEFVVGLFHEFDKLAGLTHMWDRGVPNPVASVYKTAGDMEGKDDVLFEEGNDRMSSRQLCHFVRSSNARQHLERALPNDLVDGLMGDPVAVFDSLPDPHKIMIARLATDNSIGRDPTHSQA